MARCLGHSRDAGLDCERVSFVTCEGVRFANNKGEAALERQSLLIIYTVALMRRCWRRWRFAR